MKREPVILDNDSGRIVDVPPKAPKPTKRQQPRRPANKFRRMVEDDLSDFNPLADFVEDVAGEFVDAVAQGVADAFSLDDALMRRR
jgi:hypothetical protein